MQEVVSAEPAGGRRPAQQQQFAGVDLRRPKGYTAPAPTIQPAEGGGGDPCPRCESRDTKFCYYNNYNTAQPRHFCKGCRRYWTKGGTLRNVPVGGGTRKKPSSPSTASSYAANAANKPKRPYKKKRRVAPPPEPTAAASPADVSKSTVTTAAAAPTADSAKTTTTTTTTADAASEVTTEIVAPAAAAEDDSLLLTNLLQQPDAEALALGLGLSDFPCSGGKGSAALLLEPDSFEWPPSFDLGNGGACWSTAAAGGFGDPSSDPALFLNLP